MQEIFSTLYLVLTNVITHFRNPSFSFLWMLLIGRLTTMAKTGASIFGQIHLFFVQPTLELVDLLIVEIRDRVEKKLITNFILNNDVYL